VAHSEGIRAYQQQGVQALRAAAVKAAEERRDVLEYLVAEGLSLNGIAARLNEDSVTTARGGRWTATAVKRSLSRLKSNKSARTLD
jgi:transposase